MSRTFEERMAQEDAYDRGYEAGYYAGIREGYVEATTTKHGQWINDGDCMLCSCCNYAYNSWFMGSNYCPNCGADMREGMKKNECKS